VINQPSHEAAAPSCRRSTASIVNLDFSVQVPQLDAGVGEITLDGLLCDWLARGPRL
jgi:hypothetical protein